MKNDPSRVMLLVEEALNSGRTPEAVCADYPELLPDVRSMWERCVRNAAELNELFSPTPAPALSATSLEGPGSVVGPYTLLRRIGEGGFGTVYLAEQARPMRRRVALKVVKAGMDTRDVIARFEAERQALAMMDHPNIARVFDAGATDSGRPYFVMELVDGVPIVAYCDDRLMPFRTRLELMIKVCRAVQSAHQKGIIHRDLKPSNVLVATQDGDPVPKVIDFGIAKATASSLTDRTLLTAVGGFVGTPAYMSPEQAEPAGLGIDTRTDVYGLGVLLYELLTGITPIDPTALKAAGPGEVARLILEAEPSRPSMRLSALGGALTAVAAARGSDPRRLVQLVRGELDWIVMRAIEKDRTRRYDTAAALADDLAHYLAGEPVAAGPPGRTYRVRRFARKYRAAIGVAALVAAALLMGVAGTTIGLVREFRQRRLAESRRAEADNNRRIAESALTFVDKDILARLSPACIRDQAARNEIVRAVIEPALRSIDERFEDLPAARSAVRAMLVKPLVELARYDLALPQARAAWRERQEAWGADHPETIRSLSEYATILHLLARHAEAEPLARRAWEQSRRVLDDDSPHSIPVTHSYALILTALGRHAEAETLLGQVWQRRRRELGDDSPKTIGAMTEYGMALARLCRHSEAEPLLRGACDRSCRVLGEDHPKTIMAATNYASFLHARGRLAEAEPLARRAWEWSRRVLGDDHEYTIIALSNYAAFKARQGDWAGAGPLFRQLWGSSRQALREDHPLAIRGLVNYAVCLAKGEGIEAAKPLFVDAVAAVRRAGRAGMVSFANLLYAQADFLRQVDDPAGAIAPLREATDLLRKTAPDDPNRGRDLYWLGKCLMSIGRLADAERVFRENYIYDLTHPVPDRPAMPGSLEGLIASLKAQGKPADPRTIRSEYETAALAPRRAGPGVSAGADR